MKIILKNKDWNHILHAVKWCMENIPKDKWYFYGNQMHYTTNRWIKYFESYGGFDNCLEQIGYLMQPEAEFEIRKKDAMFFKLLWS